MAYSALGEALKLRGRLDEAAAVFVSVASALNPRSAAAYWALGKVRALQVDEFESDPDDANDPSHQYAMAHKLHPSQFRLDGSRVRRIEPMSPEKEARLNAEAAERRQRILDELKDGRRKLKVAGDGKVVGEQRLE